jgi:hypothetical protein
MPDHNRFVISEMHERTKPGRWPKTTSVVAYNQAAKNQLIRSSEKYRKPTARHILQTWLSSMLQEPGLLALPLRNRIE